MAELIGARTLRVEDPRLLTGRGRYVDDIRVPGMLHAAFVRSNVAHGRIRSVDVSAARNAPGVLLAVSSTDFDGMVGMLVPGGPPGFVAPAFPVLAEDKVRCTGEPIAMVVAESRALAEDACELVDVDIEPLVAVTSIDDALDPAAPLLFEELGTNVLYQTAHTYGDPDAAFARADRIISERFTQERMANVPLEGRAFLADFEAATGELTIDVAHQNPHALRLSVAALIDHPADLVTVRCGDIGGSFGQKAYTSREEVAVAAAARLLARPVKWIEDRVENLLAAGHARDDVIEVDFALDRDATILGARVRMWVNQGAYPITVFPPTIILNLVRVLFPNAYRITDYSFEGTVVASNTGTYIAFRGPWESETWARERMIDLSARALGLEPVEVRRRNMFTSADQPTTMVTGPTIAHMTARETLDRACELADVEAFRREQEVARGDGRYLGLGIATFAEAAPGPPNYGAALGAGSSPRSAQQARARLELDGTVSVFTSQQPHGQGHETTLAQLAADGLGLPVEQVRVVHGDTSATPFNAVGTGGSRSATLASGAVVGAASLLRDRIAELFAEHHELDPGDVEVSEGKVAPRGVPASAWDLARVAELAGDIEATADFAIPDGGWTQATHCCWVEVDVNTGMVHIPRYLVVEDCGTMINPNIVEGQVSGGVAQGLSTVLYERFVYDDDGQPRAITLLDYLLPTAAEVPDIEIEHLESLPQGPIDFRGAGESGAVGSPAALTNAIEDALTPFGARVVEKYLPPDRILELVRGHRDVS
ncbi:MAG: xanthine dehydrogenase family protein molybdopterin-binding subunit [Acidimicrobiia bacterium]